LSTAPDVFENARTSIINFDKQGKRPSSRWRQSSKVFTLICNSVNIEELKFDEDKLKVHNVERSSNWQKLKLVNRLDKDNIKENITERLSGDGSVGLSLISTLRDVICSIRSLRRVVLPSIHNKKTNINLSLMIFLSY
jgi:hypothetical protein